MISETINDMIYFRHTYYINEGDEGSTLKYVKRNYWNHFMKFMPAYNKIVEINLLLNGIEDDLNQD